MNKHFLCSMLALIAAGCDSWYDKAFTTESTPAAPESLAVTASCIVAKDGKAQVSAQVKDANGHALNHVTVHARVETAAGDAATLSSSATNTAATDVSGQQIEGYAQFDVAVPGEETVALLTLWAGDADRTLSTVRVLGSKGTCP